MHEKGENTDAGEGKNYHVASEARDGASRWLGRTGRQRIRTVATNQSITPDEIYVDASGSTALADVDGTTLRLNRGGDLVLVRPCTYCGTGHFESPKIAGLADLGYALEHGLPDFAWRPLHEDCEDYYGAQDLSAW